MRMIGLALSTCVAALTLTACGTTPVASHQSSLPAKSDALVKAAAADYLAMARPINDAIQKLANASEALNPSMTSIADACEVVAAQAARFHDAMAAHRWPAQVTALAIEMEAAIRGQQASAHRCYLDAGNEEAMLSDLRGLFNPHWLATDTRWRNVLGLPKSGRVDGHPVVAT